MTATFDADELFGHVVKDVDGSRVGTVDGVFTDDDSDEPTFVSVAYGVLRRHETLVPLTDAVYDENDDLRLPFDKGRVRHAPPLDTEHDLTLADENELREYYGIPSVFRQGLQP